MIWLLIAPVPVHCFSITFSKTTGAHEQRGGNQNEMYGYISDIFVATFTLNLVGIRQQTKNQIE